MHITDRAKEISDKFYRILELENMETGVKLDITQDSIFRALFCMMAEREEESEKRIKKLEFKVAATAVSQ